MIAQFNILYSIQ